MDIATDIRVLMLQEKINMSELAEKLGTTQPNLSHKFKRNNFSIKEMQQIAESLGFNLKIEFIKG